MESVTYRTNNFELEGKEWRIAADTHRGMIRFTSHAEGAGVEIMLDPRIAARLAGFILVHNPAIKGGEALVFRSVTNGCEAIPEADFTVIPPTNGLRATTKEPDTQDDEQDTGDLHPDQERRLTALREATEVLGGRLYHDRLIECAEWILAGDTPTN